MNSEPGLYMLDWHITWGLIGLLLTVVVLAVWAGLYLSKRARR